MKKIKIRNKLYVFSCVLGLIVCCAKVFFLNDPIHDVADDSAPFIIFSGVLVYLSGYCLYRAAIAINQYFAYSDLK